jgi:Tol biopolymer transport system component
MAPDGRSFITAVGLEQKGVWVHDSRGERQISVEGRASEPRFSPDGKTLFFVAQKGASAELWFADVDSGRAEPLLPNFDLVSGNISRLYDISPDGRQVVVHARDAEGKDRIWIAPLNRRSPPRQIPNAEGDGPLFGPDGKIYFRAREGTYGFAYHVREDGSDLRKAIDYPVISTEAISPDGKWLIVYGRYARAGEEPIGATLALPLDGGPAVHVFRPDSSPRWTRDGKFMFFVESSTSYSGSSGRALVIPLPAGQVWPALPADTLQAESDLAKRPGVRTIDAVSVVPGSTADVYAFSRETIQRNLYRIPVQ